jgi:hypothetical protein
MVEVFDTEKGFTLRSGGVRNGRDLLTEGLRRVDVAMAQRNLMHGDILLSTLYSKYVEASKTARDIKASREKATAARNRLNEIVLLLDENQDPDLAVNFLVYLLVKEFEKNKTNILQYQAALATGGIHPARVWGALIELPLEFLYSDRADGEEFYFSVQTREDQRVVTEARKLKVPKGWSVRWNGTIVRMPSESAIRQGALRVADDLRELGRRRGEIIDALASYGFLSDPALTESARALIERGFVLQALNARPGTARRVE